MGVQIYLHKALTESFTDSKPRIAPSPAGIITTTFTMLFTPRQVVVATRASRSTLAASAAAMVATMLPGMISTSPQGRRFPRHTDGCYRSSSMAALLCDIFRTRGGRTASSGWSVPGPADVRQLAIRCESRRFDCRM